MCIAIYKKPEGTVTDEQLKNCFESNGDGCGFGYIHTDSEGKKEIRVGKYMKYNDFLENYHESLAANPESPFFIHFRIKTAGKINKANCHPFFVDDSTIMMHNGIITGVGTDVDRSDTRLFNDNYLKKLPEGWMNNEGIGNMIENIIGPSKIVVMDIEGNISMYNGDKGHWKEDVWFSNYSYQEKKTTYYGNGWKPGRSSGSFGTTSSSYNTHGTGGVVKSTLYSSHKCDVCGCFRQIQYMYPYLLGDDFTIYCISCHNKVVETDNVKSYEKISSALYVSFLNMPTFKKSSAGREYPLHAVDSWEDWDDAGVGPDGNTSEDDMYDALAEHAKNIAN